MQSMHLHHKVTALFFYLTSKLEIMATVVWIWWTSKVLRLLVRTSAVEYATDGLHRELQKPKSISCEIPIWHTMKLQNALNNYYTIL